MVIKEEDLEVPLESQKKLIDIMLDSGMFVSVGDNQYEIKGLRSWSRLRICEVFLKIEECDNKAENLIRAGATNLKYAAEIVAIVLLNHQFTMNNDENERMIEDMTRKVLLTSYDENEWVNAVFTAVSSLNLEAVFTISSLGKVICSTLTRKRMMIVEQLQSMRPQ